MKLESSVVPLAIANKFARIIGTYRLIDQKMYPHEFAKFVWMLTISDGKSTLDVQSFKPVIVPIGCFVTVDIVAKSNQVYSVWRAKAIKLSTVPDALSSCGLHIDKRIQTNAAKMSLGEQFDNITTPSLLKLKKLYYTGFAQKNKLEQDIGFYDMHQLREMLSWLLSIRFKQASHLDYAVFGGLLFTVFNRFLTPDYRLDISKKSDMTFSSFVEDAAITLNKLDVDIFRAIQVTYMHTVKWNEFKVEKSHDFS